MFSSRFANRCKLERCCHHSDCGCCFCIPPPNLKRKSGFICFRWELTVATRISSWMPARKREFLRLSYCGLHLCVCVCMWIFLNLNYPLAWSWPCVWTIPIATYRDRQIFCHTLDIGAIVGGVLYFSDNFCSGFFVCCLCGFFALIQTIFTQFFHIFFFSFPRRSPVPIVMLLSLRSFLDPSCSNSNFRCIRLIFSRRNLYV